MTRPFVFKSTSTSINLFILLLATLVLMPLKSFAQVNLEDGLIAYFPFCGNAEDESNNANHGDVNDALLVEDRFGNPEGAYKFDGVDDYINCGNDSTLNDAFTGLTISSWIYLLPGGEDQQQIIGKWNNTIANDHFTVIIDKDNRVLFAIANPNNSANGYRTDRALKDETWYHILTTWDNTGAHKVYVDKNLELDAFSFSFNWISTTSAVDLKIGRQILPSMHNRAFNGMIDDLRIYNRVLNQSEIDSLFQVNPKQITSTENLQLAESNISVFPNPTSNQINLAFQDSYKVNHVHLFDASGRNIAVYNNIADDVFAIDASNLPKGIIFLKVFNQERNLVKKVIIK